MKNIFIIIGHYGSGKTEFSINYAVNQGCKILVDLDIVNPYFRSSDVRAPLKNKGIKVISPIFANTNVDAPGISSAVYSVFEGEDDVVFDVGGDNDGAVVLGRFHNYFEKNGYEMYMVINANRPLTSNEDEIIENLRAIESASRLKVTGLVNNTNLMEFTTIDNILIGHEIIKKVSEKTNIPIVHISGMNNVLESLPDDLKPLSFVMDKYLTKPWEQNLKTDNN